MPPQKAAIIIENAIRDINVKCAALQSILHNFGEQLCYNAGVGIAETIRDLGAIAESLKSAKS